MFDIDIHKVADVLRYNPQEMLTFNSAFFLFWVTAVLLIYYKLRSRDTLKIAFLLTCSLYFYYKTNGFYFLLLLFVVTSDFCLARLMGRTTVPSRRKVLLITSILIDLGLLAYFKYTNFLYEMGCQLLSRSFSPLDIMLPVGISFFTFQSISYVVDVYREEIKPLNRWADYAFYVSFFPQLVAGPIVRAQTFIPQIHTNTPLLKKDWGKAFALILTGLFKKCVISDYISINFVDRVFDAPALYSGLENLFAVYGYAVQIYCDFSGYSDIAIGIALLFGYRLGINFNMPYRSASITEFWHRWHISLSSWLKDYLYISLGGNRKGRLRTYLNLMITMLLGGLWHGASLRFLLWGGMHGLLLAGHKFLMSCFPTLKSSGAKMSTGHRTLGIFITFHLVCLGWIFFRADSMETAWSVLTQIFAHFNGRIFLPFAYEYAVILLLMTLCLSTQFLSKRFLAGMRYRIAALPWSGKAIILTLLILLIDQIKSAEVQPFIYFQF